MAIIEVSIVPLGTGTPSLSQYIARTVKVLEERKDIKYELTSMGTILEGDLEQLLDAVRNMHETVFDAGAVRVLTTIKIEDRRDKASTMTGKIESVKRELKRQG